LNGFAFVLINIFFQNSYPWNKSITMGFISSDVSLKYYWYSSR
jgi:hypothetical protein